MTSVPAVIITGAGSGIGRATALEFVSRGHDVILGVRNLASAEAVADEARRRGFSRRVLSYALDVGNLNSISSFIAGLACSGVRISGLVNNAGVCRLRETFSPQEIESTLAINALGSFALSVLCLQRGIFFGRGKILNIGTHILPLELDRCRIEGSRRFSVRDAYMQSKLAMVMLAIGLAKRTPPDVCEITSIYPGIVRSNLGRESPLTKLLGALFDPFIEAPEKAALRIVDLYQQTAPLHGRIFSKSGPVVLKYKGDFQSDLAWLMDFASKQTALSLV